MIWFILSIVVILIIMGLSLWSIWGFGSASSQTGDKVKNTIVVVIYGAFFIVLSYGLYYIISRGKEAMFRMQNNARAQERGMQFNY